MILLLESKTKNIREISSLTSLVRLTKVMYGFHISPNSEILRCISLGKHTLTLPKDKDLRRERLSMSLGMIKFTLKSESIFPET